MKHPQPKQASPGIWIPRAIWLLRGLSLREKALLAELAAHAAEPDYRASKERLTGLLGIRPRQVRACLATRGRGGQTAPVALDLTAMRPARPRRQPAGDVTTPFFIGSVFRPHVRVLYRLEPCPDR